MIYIYDIILNFNERLYEFYEWNENDNIEYVKRIPIFKVTNDVFSDLKNNKVVVSNEFINNIYNKCEVYGNYGIGKIDYVCLFCIDDVISIEFNEKGEVIYISDLYIDEKLDILSYVKKLNNTVLEYKKINKYKDNLMTRKELSMIKFIKREINLIYKSDNLDKLRYIYYECFNKIEENISKINSDLEKYVFECPNKLYDLLMLSYSKGLQS